METVQPRNSPDSKAMTQDNVVKAPVYMPKPDNLAGNESGPSTTAGLGTTSGTQAPFTPPTNEINPVFTEVDQRSPRTKGFESQDIPEAGRNQYQ